jgi:DNA-binding NtrC family response regulator
MATDHTGRVLLVEDEEAVRRVMRRILEKGGFAVEGAATGAEAIRVSREADEPFDALLTDVVLAGGMSGPDLAAAMQKQDRDLGCVLVSGWTQEHLVNHGAVGSGCIFLAKPFTVESLLEAVSFAVYWRRIAAPQAGCGTPPVDG